MRHLLAAALLALAGCGGSSDRGITNPPPKKPKPDPFVTIRVRDQLDTTTAPGRAHWHMFAILTGPYDAQNGIAPTGKFDLDDMRHNRTLLCVAVSADSVGQRLLSVVAFADTTTEQDTPEATPRSLAAAWFAGTQTMPAGWMALSFPATDAWQSDQYVAGHGLTQSDPIKWGFDWTAGGTTAFYERTDNDTACGTFQATN